MNQRKRAAVLMIMALFAVSATFYRLENWTQHEENLLILILTRTLFPACIALIAVHAVQGIREKEWLWMTVGILFGVIGLWGLIAYMNIPICLECGGVTADELGWMAPWFYPQ